MMQVLKRRITQHRSLSYLTKRALLIHTFSVLLRAQALRGSLKCLQMCLQMPETRSALAVPSWKRVYWNLLDSWGFWRLSLPGMRLHPVSNPGCNCRNPSCTNLKHENWIIPNMSGFLKSGACFFVVVVFMTLHV